MDFLIIVIGIAICWTILWHRNSNNDAIRFAINEAIMPFCLGWCVAELVIGIVTRLF